MRPISEKSVSVVINLMMINAPVSPLPTRAARSEDAQTKGISVRPPTTRLFSHRKASYAVSERWIPHNNGRGNAVAPANRNWTCHDQVHQPSLGNHDRKIERSQHRPAIGHADRPAADDIAFEGLPLTPRIFRISAGTDIPPKYLNVRKGGRIVCVATIIAVAVNRRERRAIVGLHISPSEAETFWASFLKDLEGSSLTCRKPAISNAHESSKAAIPRIIGATGQRCRVHFMHNGLAWVPERQHTKVSAVIRSAFIQPDQSSAIQIFPKSRPTLLALAEARCQHGLRGTPLLAYARSPPGKARSCIRPVRSNC